MESWIAFSRGAMFRLSFTLMLLGLLRIFFLAFVNGVGKSSSNGNSSQRANGHHTYRLRSHLRLIGSLWVRRPINSLIATLFHIGLIVVPFFLAAHVIQWKQGVGFAWWALPQHSADLLTLTVIVTAPILTIYHLARVVIGRGRIGMRLFWPLLIAIPFASGYLCVNGDISPKVYYSSFLIHIISGNLLMLAIPFTRAAVCVLQPVAILIADCAPGRWTRRKLAILGLLEQEQ